MEYKISKESVDKVFTNRVEITNVEDLALGKSLSEFIYEAYQAALKEDIRANTVMISKRLAKVNRFSCSFFANSYNEFPPLICGLEAYVTDELPEEFAFGVVEAPTTQREAVYEDGRKFGYKVGYDQGYEQGIKDFAERLKTYYNSLRGTTYAALAAYHIEETMKQMLPDTEGG